jgi:hypothetical protein
LAVACGVDARQQLVTRSLLQPKQEASCNTSLQVTGDRTLLVPKN